MTRDLPAMPIVLRLLRRWWWVVVLSCVLTVGASFAITKRIKPTYEATVELYVNAAALTNSASVVQDPHVALGQAAALADMVTSYEVAKQAADSAPLGITPAQLLAETSASADATNPILTLSVDDPNQARVAKLANSLASTLISVNTTSQGDRYKDLENTIRDQITTTTNSINTYNSQVRSLTTSGGTNLSLTTQISDLTQQIEGLQTTLSSLKAQLNDVLLSQVQSATTLTVIAGAQSPSSPISPSLHKNLLLGLILGILLAGGIVALMYRLDDPLPSPQDVEQRLNLAVLALVPRVPDAAKRDSLAEALRALHLTVSSSRTKKPIRRILVVSGKAGEGKTTIASNYAVAAAQAGERVVLIDGDMRNPNFHDLFALDPSPGLADMLRGMPFTPAILHKCGVNNLRVICSGGTPSNPYVLLNSTRLGPFLDTLSTHADLVILDCPPLLEASDASALVRHVDAVLLVLDQETTAMRGAAQTLRQLRLVGAPVIGAVINRLDVRHTDYGWSVAHIAVHAEADPVDSTTMESEPDRLAEAKWKV